MPPSQTSHAQTFADELILKLFSRALSPRKFLVHSQFLLTNFFWRFYSETFSGWNFSTLADFPLQTFPRFFHETFVAHKLSPADLFTLVNFSTDFLCKLSCVQTFVGRFIRTRELFTRKLSQIRPNIFSRKLCQIFSDLFAKLHSQASLSQTQTFVGRIYSRLRTFSNKQFQPRKVLSFTPNFQILSANFLWQTFVGGKLFWRILKIYLSSTQNSVGKLQTSLDSSTNFPRRFLKLSNFSRFFRKLFPRFYLETSHAQTFVGRIIHTNFFSLIFLRISPQTFSRAKLLSADLFSLANFLTHKNFRRRFYSHSQTWPNIFGFLSKLSLINSTCRKLPLIISPTPNFPHKLFEKILKNLFVVDTNFPRRPLIFSEIFQTFLDSSANFCRQNYFHSNFHRHSETFKLTNVSQIFSAQTFVGGFIRTRKLFTHKLFSARTFSDFFPNFLARETSHAKLHLWNFH